MPQTNSGDRVLALGTGNAAGRPVVVERACDGWRSVYVSVSAVTPSMFREIYRRAGVHLYADRDVVLSANEAWVMFRRDGDRGEDCSAWSQKQLVQKRP